MEAKRRAETAKSPGPYRRRPSAFLLPRRWPEYLVPVSGGDDSHPLHLGLVGRPLRLGRDAQLSCRLSHLPDEILEARGREDEQQPRGPRVHRERVGNLLWTEEERAGPRLYGLISHVEGHLAFEDPEAFVLEVVDVQRTREAFGGEYLYQGVAPAGLLGRGLYGGQHPYPPQRLAFSRLVREGPARGIFLRLERGPRPGSVFRGRHIVFLLSLHNSVQRTMTEDGPSVKVGCTDLCNNFSPWHENTR